MSTFQEDIRSYIETTLNTIGETYDTAFKIYNYEAKENEYQTREVLKEGKLYQTEEKAFIPGVLVDYIGDVVPIQGLTAIDYTIPLEFRVNVDGDLLTNISDVFTTASLQGFLDTMEEFRSTMAGNFTTINNLNYVFNVDTLTPIGDVEYVQGYNYVNFGINIIANSGDVFFGNQWKYTLGRVSSPFIDNVDVVPFDRVMTKGYTPETHQILNSNTALSINNDNVWQGTFSFYYTQTIILSEIVKQIQSNNYSQNTVYRLEISYPAYSTNSSSWVTVTDTKEVIIDGGSVLPSLGEKVVITLSFREYAL